jgi:hypothetical protein
VNERNQIRAETPVRPLTGQFLDTFRNWYLTVDYLIK